MFETSVVKSQAAVAPRSTGFLAMSLGVHSGVIVAIVALSIAGVEFPSNAPDQFGRLQLVEPVSLPPALGRPDGGAKPAAAVPPKAQAERPVVPTQPVAPSTVPDSITAESSTVSTTTADPIAGGDGTGTQEGPLGQETGSKDGVGAADPSSNIGIGTGPAVPVVEDSTIYRVGADVTAARVLQRVLPVYPRIMIETRMGATVSVKCIVDRHGRVRDVEIVRSSFPPFNDAVIAALHKWTFSPGTLRGTPVDTYFELTARFAVQ